MGGENRGARRDVGHLIGKELTKCSAFRNGSKSIKSRNAFYKFTQRGVKNHVYRFTNPDTRDS